MVTADVRDRFIGVERRPVLTWQSTPTLSSCINDMVLMEVLVGESARTCNVLPMVKKNTLLVPNTLISATWLPPASNRQHPPRVARRKLEIPAPKSLYGRRWFATFNLDVEEQSMPEQKASLVWPTCVHGVLEVL